MTINEMSKIHRNLSKAVTEWRDSHNGVKGSYPDVSRYPVIAERFYKACKKLSKVCESIGIDNITDAVVMAGDEEAFVIFMATRKPVDVNPFYPDEGETHE